MRPDHLVDFAGGNDSGGRAGESHLPEFHAADWNQRRTASRSARFGERRAFRSRHGSYRAARIDGNRRDPIAVCSATSTGDIRRRIDRDLSGRGAGPRHAGGVQSSGRNVHVVVAGGGGWRNGESGQHAIAASDDRKPRRLTPRLVGQSKLDVVAGIGQVRESLLIRGCLIFDLGSGQKSHL